MINIQWKKLFLCIFILICIVILNGCAASNKSINKSNDITVKVAESHNTIRVGDKITIMISNYSTISNIYLKIYLNSSELIYEKSFYLPKPSLHLEYFTIQKSGMYKIIIENKGVIIDDELINVSKN